MSGKRIIDGLNEFLTGAPFKVIGFDEAQPGSDRTEYFACLSGGVRLPISESEYHRIIAKNRRREANLTVINGGPVADAANRR